MSKERRRQPSPASRKSSVRNVPQLFTARQRELNTKRRGELAELAFTLKAARLGFGVSRPFGDSERYDAIIDARDLSPTRKHPCNPSCLVLRPSRNKRVSGDSRKLEVGSQNKSGCPTLPGVRRVGIPMACPISRAQLPREAFLFPPLWRVQVKCSTQLDDGMYHLNAHRRTGGRALPYLPGEIDFLAAYIIPEDTWYIIPLEAFLGSTSLLFRRRTDPKPGLYDAYREAWHLLRPK
jgi:hypothetical protein